MWDDGGAAGPGRRDDRERPAGKPAGKVVVVLAFIAAVLVTLVLCCAAVGRAASLFEIDPVELW